MIHHYFISINVPKDIATKIKEKIDNKFKNVLIGTETAINKYHLTLKFFGEIDDDNICKIKRKLEEIIFNKFYIKIGKLGFFENRFRGILYVELNSEVLNNLVFEIWEKVGGENRQFRSHVTLFRSKKCLDKAKLEGLMKEVQFGDLGFEVHEFSLMRSELKKTGSEYRVLKNFELK